MGYHTLAVFGAGRMGTIHMRHLSRSFTGDKVRIRYVVDHQGALDKVKQTLGTLGLKDVLLLPLEEAETVFKDASVNAVLVCSPVATHFSLVTSALKSGKSVFCEKPLGVTLEEVKECVALAKENGGHLVCGFNRRLDPTHREVYNTTRSGDLGKIRVIRSISRDPPAMSTVEYIASSGGIFLDSAIHDLDLVTWMAGEAPSSMYAVGHADVPMYVQCGDVDTCNVIVTFPSGTIANIEVSREAPIGHDTRVEVLCEKALLKSENRSPLQMETWTTSGATKSPIYEQGVVRYMESYRKEMEYFINVLDGSRLR